MAFGVASSTRPSASTTMAPSPTRGVSSAATSSSWKGKVDSEIIVQKRSNTSR